MGIRRLADYPFAMSSPTEKLRVVIDSDTANEIDDQFALVWALLSSETLRIEGVHAAPFSHGRYFEALADASRKRGGPRSDFDRISVRMSAPDLEALVERTPPEAGMDRSHTEILRVFEACGIPPGDRVRRGATAFLPGPRQPVESDAAEHLIALANTASPKEPIHVAAIGAPTNVASALLLAPEIAANLRVIFLAGFPSGFDLTDDSFNLVQDRFASNVLFESQVPLLYIPGYQVAETLQLSLPAAREWLSKGTRPARFLYETFLNNPINPSVASPGKSWVLWDLIAIAALLSPAWVPSREVRRARVNEQHGWEPLAPSAGQMSEAYQVKRNEVFEDLLRKLAQAPDSADAVA